MTLATHAVVGAAIASFFPDQPVLAVGMAFASHFVIDAIPHWDYAIRSESINPTIGARMKYDRAFVMDVLTIGTDAICGIVISLFFFSAVGDPLILLIGAFAGILPDPLQFVYAHFKHEPLVTLQRFHKWIHTAHRLRAHAVTGSLSQVAFVGLVIFATRALH